MSSLSFSLSGGVFLGGSYKLWKIDLCSGHVWLFPWLGEFISLSSCGELQFVHPWKSNPSVTSTPRQKKPLACDAWMLLIATPYKPGFSRETASTGEIYMSLSTCHLSGDIYFKELAHANVGGCEVWISRARQQAAYSGDLTLVWTSVFSRKAFNG